MPFNWISFGLAIEIKLLPKIFPTAMLQKGLMDSLPNSLQCRAISPSRVKIFLASVKSTKAAVLGSVYTLIFLDANVKWFRCLITT